MRWFRRFVARLLNIQPEDLPQAVVTTAQDMETEIAHQVRREVQRAIQQTVLPYIQELSEKNAPGAIGKAQTEVTAGSAPAEDELADQGSFEEFPVIEEDLTTSLLPPTPISIVDTHPPSIELSPVDEEILPLDLHEEIKPSVARRTPELIPLDPGSIRIGIDFGTTTTAVSLKIGDDLPEALPIGLDGTTRYMPSVVYIQPGIDDISARVIVGEEAENIADQANTIRSIKRCLACDGTHCRGMGEESKNEQESRFPWCNGDGTVVTSAEETLPPSLIVSFILQEALSRAVTLSRERLKLDLTSENVVLQPLNLGCGANFNFNQRKLLIQVAHQVGFTTVTIDNIVEEPILAGFAFSRFSDDPVGKSLIYDFGGGTFDVAVISVDHTPDGLRVTVLSTAGEQWLGGDDIDTLVYDYFLEQLAEEHGESVSAVETGLSNSDRSRLRVMARSAKEQLSTENIYRNTMVSDRSKLLSLDLSRDNFEQILAASGLFEKSLETARRACQLAYTFENAQKHDLIDAAEISRFSAQDMANFIDRLILVGGVTRIPYIQNNLRELFREKIVAETVIEPISAVSIGSAYPHDLQHFSIICQPYRFLLEGEDSTTGERRLIKVFEYYEQYNFHDYWATKGWPAYIKHIQNPYDLKFCTLYYQRAGNPEKVPHQNIGPLRAGDWQFGIYIDGNMFARLIGGGNTITIDPFPQIHPVQMAILEAQRAMRESRQKQDNSTYDEQIRSMMYDN